MALLEYNIQYDETSGETKVICNVLEVDKSDRIRFKSNNAGTVINYKKDSPFNEADAPHAGENFTVGKGKTAEFAVAKHLTAKNKLHFQCGALVPGKNAMKLAPWGSGGDTPSGAEGNLL